jgi:hypothetical protein
VAVGPGAVGLLVLAEGGRAANDELYDAVLDRRSIGEIMCSRS